MTDDVEIVECNSMALTTTIALNMEQSLGNNKIIFARRGPDCLEAETSGVKILNILGEFEYKVYGQSMAMEETNIGGRTIKVQKLVWTMGK